MPSRDVDIDDASRWITQHIALEGLALDREASDRTRRPGKLAHVPYFWFLVISQARINERDGLGPFGF
jgi:hypothetical protein